MFTADRFKLILAVLILASGIGTFYYLGGQPEAVRVAVVVVAGVVAAVVALQTAQGRSAWEFAKGARQELRKVVWPTRKETLQMTLVVVVMVILVAIFLWVVDWLLVWALKAFTGKGA